MYNYAEIHLKIIIEYLNGYYNYMYKYIHILFMRMYKYIHKKIIRGKKYNFFRKRGYFYSNL